MVRFNLRALLQGQTRIARSKSAYKSLIIGPRALQCEINLWEIVVWESSNVVRLYLWPLLQGQTRIVKIISAYNSLILVPSGLQCDTNL